MKPRLTFHGVAKVTLTPVEKFPATDESAPFAVREIILTGQDGERFHIEVYSPDADALDIYRGSAATAEVTP